VIRNDETTPLKAKDDIYLNDVCRPARSRRSHHLQRRHHLNLKANSQITVDSYVYEEAASRMRVFDVAKAPSRSSLPRWPKPAT